MRIERSKKMKRLNLIILIIAIILFLILLFTNFINYKDLHDDVFFIRIFKNQSDIDNDGRNKNIEVAKVNNLDANNDGIDNVQYIFNIEYKNTKFKDINLLDTISSKVLVNEKIAPGAKGYFDIIIYSNYNTKYNIYFKSITKKPQNLRFFVVGHDTYKESLEDLSSDLFGIIQKGDRKTITIGWEWTYENGSLGNLQDTSDADLMDKYIFNILALGEEII